MRAVAITGTKSLALVDKPEPRATNDIVKVQLRVAPMCTEFKSYDRGLCPIDLVMKRPESS
jgi:hypothetical protein